MQYFLTLKSKYFPLLKAPQTALLLLTGMAGYLSSHKMFDWKEGLALAGSLFLAISGSTVLNMWYDRDIDAQMMRTCWRPLPVGSVKPEEALRFGLGLSVLGIGWAFWMDWMFGTIVTAGLFFDVVIYTLWLKRRTALSILWGGVSGGMPVLAGRVLGLGWVDGTGVLLTLAIIFWIPTHILTFSMRYFDDYCKAGVPTFPERYGFQFTRLAIAISSVVASLILVAAALAIGFTSGYLRLMLVLSTGMFSLALASLLKPSERINFGLFKYASLYMMSAMLLLVVQAI